jgi:hypothetical protein
MFVQVILSRRAAGVFPEVRAVARETLKLEAGDYFSTRNLKMVRDR